MKHKAKAHALATYARLAKDYELEKRSVEIRERARIKLGELSLALPINIKGRPSAKESRSGSGTTLPTKLEALADAGVTKAESHRAEKLAKKSEEAREAHVAKAVDAVEKRNTAIGSHQHITSSESVEWFTPDKYIRVARQGQQDARTAVYDVRQSACLRAALKGLKPRKALMAPKNSGGHCRKDNLETFAPKKLPTQKAYPSCRFSLAKQWVTATAWCLFNKAKSLLFQGKYDFTLGA